MSEPQLPPLNVGLLTDEQKNHEADVRAFPIPAAWDDAQIRALNLKIFRFLDSPANLGTPARDIAAELALCEHHFREISNHQTLSNAIKLHRYMHFYYRVRRLPEKDQIKTRREILTNQFLEQIHLLLSNNPDLSLTDQNSPLHSSTMLNQVQMDNNGATRVTGTLPKEPQVFGRSEEQEVKEVNGGNGASGGPKNSLRSRELPDDASGTTNSDLALEMRHLAHLMQTLVNLQMSRVETDHPAGLPQPSNSNDLPNRAVGAADTNGVIQDSVRNQPQILDLPARRGDVEEDELASETCSQRKERNQALRDLPNWFSRMSFDGTRINDKYMSVEDFLTSVDTFRGCCRVPDQDLLSYLLRSFRGVARQWFTNQRHTFISYNDFRIKFRQRFSDKRDPVDIMFEVGEVKFDPKSQSLLAHIDDLAYRMNNSPYAFADPQQLRVVMKTLPSSIQTAMDTRGVKTN
ncbi:uncharacterized protein LOC118734111 [Rhagoletis pomonella]|uniref:uncharacterized protein LOC118734111 n=1 Tax=Rhagoletis pomonella TaxID=28610 RepID=UPI00177C3920|nr:uncharacterized protein LOC118734111 [Rhagoletis pomonella]